MTHWGPRLHAALFRLTRGRLLSRMGGQPVLVLETIGRRTQRRRATPVQYLACGHEFVVVASDRGAARPPAWYLNLRASPDARLQVGARTIDVHARETSGDERAALWQRLTATNRFLEPAAAKAGRELPLMALTPVAPGAGR
jgi:deazaflavin-dependent oxidoreductase (nitroreductase family)